MLAASSIFSQFAVNVAFTNNAAGPTDRAIVSGFAVTVDTVGKAIAPIATSTIFAWSINTFGLAGHGLVFYIQAPEIGSDTIWFVERKDCRDSSV